MRPVLLLGEKLDSKLEAKLLSDYDCLDPASLNEQSTELIEHLCTNECESFIVIDTSQLRTLDQIAFCIDMLEQKNNGMVLRHDPSCLCIANSPSHVVADVTNASPTPVVALSCQPAMLQIISIMLDEYQHTPSFTSISLILAFLSLTPDFEVYMTPLHDVLHTPFRLPETNESACLLKSCIDLFNIEEIFPELDWTEQSQESATLAYHNLAASFLKLNDQDAALQCLEISDSFIETPRSYAIRGAIASQKGDQLAAVANIVSSLQQYEERANSKPLHEQVEKSVTDCLHNGLEALNKKDNEVAFKNFAEAVSKYDPYFEDRGLIQFFTLATVPTDSKEM